MPNDKFPLKSFILFCLVVAGLTLAILYPKLTEAEIATTRDWIGLFPSGSSGQSNCGTNGTTSCDSKLGTVNGNTWVYTSTCNQSVPPGTTPKLADLNGCPFNPSPAPPYGDYEYRLYANNQDSADALLATSKKITIGPIPGPLTDCPVQPTNPRVKSGLISAPNIEPNFGNPEGRCVVDPKAAFAPYEIDPYEDLKSKYYTQAKSSALVNKVDPIKTPFTLGDFNSAMTAQGDALFLVQGDLTIDASNFPTTLPNKSAVIFVEENLSITKDITFGENNTGLVFVVKGDVIINPSVTLINAVIISSGTIYTAGANCATSSVTEVSPGTPISPLTINGSLVSINPGKIIFCRALNNNNSPAEIINQQSKYLVILRNLYSDNPAKWSEIP